jgi:hypothetical protein
VARGKDAQEQVQGIWVYELAELSGFGKAEIELIKAFISAKVDRYRPSYGRVVESFSRQCIMVGTTNLRTYLKDRTGNRRFWPIPVRHRIKLDWVARVREQLLAEAYALYLEGVRFHPTFEDEERLFVPMQMARVVDTAVQSEMLHVLTRAVAPGGPGAIVNCLTNFVTLSQMTMALGIDAAKSTAGLEGQVRAWFDGEGWERAKKMINGVRAWGWIRPAMWPPVEADEPESPDIPQTDSNAPAGSSEALSPAARFTQEADDAPF